MSRRLTVLRDGNVYYLPDLTQTLPQPILPGLLLAAVGLASVLLGRAA